MKIVYEDWCPSAASLALVTDANEIIAEYEADEYTLTLRQLYYQFVSRDLIENTEKSYKRIGSLITKARMAGMISWNAIEDRNRTHNSFWYDEDYMSPIMELPDLIRFDRWARQEVYVEAWVEKEALGNVLARVCDKYLVPHMACKGYLSASEAWRAGQRFDYQLGKGKKCILLHLGDHDPSGVDMTRDNNHRLQIFSGARWGGHNEGGSVEVRRLALNMDQVEEHTPPPNPTKVTDSRASDYIKKFGHTCWELDALDPKTLEELLTDEIRSLINAREWQKVNEEEENVKATLADVAENWDEIEQFLKER